jgi:hypothetical protein
MRDWPPIAEPELLERLAMDDDRFRALVEEVMANWPSREFDPAAFEQALGYPFDRPPGSYLLSGDRVEMLADLDPATRESTIAAFTGDRYPIVSFGANAAPARLAMKFAHFEEETDREALVLTGELHDLDVGAVAGVPLLGYMPGTLFDSPGTAVRAAVIWVTLAQVTQLAWSELTYRLSRLEETRFEVDEADLEIEDVFAFVSRLGAFCLDGAPVALAAVPARNRTATALTQPELLEALAALTIGPGAGAEDLGRAICVDMQEVFARARETVWPNARHLTSRSTPFPASRAR